MPSELEWNFAASGGAEQRVYPWKAPDSGPSITSSDANYGNSNPGPVAVGSTPPGDGRWGQCDLAGNVIEWALDYYGDYPAECKDCLISTPAVERVQRGGAYPMDESLLVSSFRTSSDPSMTRSFFGFRCAHDLK